ncbi:DUF3520 domain-containing protein [Rubellimicrobium rubrum]|uniref:DUF3520 domain-containing protein n=1 Tax=Rubellimicrobium rubrum TaxID=2585369 RepID=A0A5C4N735_9RHOB|nr:VWA domain-containing protein [Rubellimicrobium rubrum]TNC52473.1 DUF3520 domain-containing protein [Rubellimicrobium rubrum]
MTPDDDLDDLRSALEQVTPKPDPATRAAHLRLAQENFDRLQGAAHAPRPSSERPRRGAWSGARDMMNAITLRGGLTATTALAACGFLVLTPAGRTLLLEPFERGEVSASDPAPALAATEEAVARPSDPLAPAPEEASLPQAKVATGDEDARSVQAAPDLAVQEEMPGDLSGAASAEVPEAEPLPDPIAPVWVLPPEEAEAAPRSPSADPEAFAPLPPAVGRLERRAAPAPGGLLSRGLVLAPRSMDSLAPLPTPSTESFANADPNPLKVTAEEPVSTFSIDVDTASYGVVRQSLLSGALPPPDAVRTEEMVNYFPYDYPAPEAGEGPFRPTVSVMTTPWNPDTRLVAIGLQGQRPAVEDRPPLNLVFLIDTSGSMDDPRKLPLLRQSFGLMVGELRPEDQVAIVAYAGSAGLVLPPTPASDREAILGALGGLTAGGSTNGQGGLEQAYDTARRMASEGEVSRVILATDGDFNVGLSDPEGLEDYVAQERESGVFLSVLGFGRGNLEDATMQALAQNGNGQAAYIDSLQEAQKVLVDQLSGEMFPIAQDVKVQVEWNSATIAEYRVIGYETRALRREDFANDRVDAGELGAGHSVTALYEVTLVDSPARLTEPLRYQPERVAQAGSDEWGLLRLRWKEPGGEQSQLFETPITGTEEAGSEAHFAAAVAGWAQILREGGPLGDWGHEDAIGLATANRGEDPFGYRTEAVRLMRLSQSLSQR